MVTPSQINIHCHECKNQGGSKLSSLNIEFRYWSKDSTTDMPKDITVHQRGGIFHSLHYIDIHAYGFDGEEETRGDGVTSNSTFE